jgi:hypothetical protein
MPQPGRQSRLGRYETTTFGGEPARAFVPPPLPPTRPINVSGLLVPLQRAQMVLGGLDGMATILPDTNLFHEPLPGAFDEAGAMAKDPPRRAAAPAGNRGGASNHYLEKRSLKNTKIMMEEQKMHVLFVARHSPLPGLTSKFSSQRFDEGNCICKILRLA